MSLRAARVLAVTYHLLALVFVTWPGAVPFARIRPLVLGLPFAMAWIAGWVAGSAVVLYLLDRVERRHRPEPPSGPGAAGRSHPGPDAAGASRQTPEEAGGPHPGAA